MVSIPVHRGPQQVALGLSFLRWLDRTRLDARFGHEVGCCKEWVDDLLLAVWSAGKRESLRPGGFWALHRQYARLLLPSDSMEAVLAEKDSWSSVEQHLRKLVGSSRLGDRLFNWALQKVVMEKVHKSMQQVLVGFHTRDMNEEVYQELRESMKKQVPPATPKLPEPPPPRNSSPVRPRVCSAALVRKVLRNISEALPEVGRLLVGPSDLRAALVPSCWFLGAPSPHCLA